ncbi:unnamed protein product [Lactuca virosa]|uniref:Uncharacterized protein n=1 Tax=Lactuca virosa TaxID=75947 RepID=A0AAU9LXQ2_9ASTR|nr:unnamed protein product [Lactuca virosa]
MDLSRQSKHFCEKCEWLMELMINYNEAVQEGRYTDSSKPEAKLKFQLYLTKGIQMLILITDNAELK